jgi:hypothetical protein
MDRRAVQMAAARQAAQILITAMPTQLWPIARARATRLLGNGNALKEQALLQELEASRITILINGISRPVTRQAVTDKWMGEFAERSNHDPCTPMELRAFSDALAYLLETLPCNRSHPSGIWGYAVSWARVYGLPVKAARSAS